MLAPALLLIVVSVVLVAGCGSDEPATKPAPLKPADAGTVQALQEILDLQRESYGATGMAAAIVIDGRHFWSGGSGVSDRKTRTPVAADTPFPIFSITKMFTGALAVKLAEEGRLALDDPLSQAVPDWPDADRITLRMLLNQTSGIGNAQRRLERATETRPRVVWTPEETLRYAKREPHKPPGETWEYNNANFVLAALMIEEATGRPANEALREAILDPLKLDDTLLQPDERPPGDTAHGYGGPPRIARALRIGGPYAPYPAEASWLWTAGGMVSSAPSVAHFADALLRGDLISPDSRRQLLDFVPAAEGFVGYGLGVGKGQAGVDDVWFHPGGGPGFVTSVAHVPAKKITVAVLSSGDADLRLLSTLLVDEALAGG